ncbi:hypothetical protein KKF84_11980, partial [Myxococcota bacterium]|nr:hypothetical protein [Myxococcota bacterium]
PYPDAGYLGHIDGAIFNNMIAATSAALFASDSGFDAGITLEQARGALVYHNTVCSSTAPFSSIEWRWDNTMVYLYNNLVCHNLRDRGGEAVTGGNVENADISWFEDLNTGDLHLTVGSASVGTPVPVDEESYYSYDFDGDERTVPLTPGADEPQ